MRRFQQVTPAANDPISLTQAKAHLNVDGTYDDTIIATLLTAATQWLQSYTRRIIATETWKVILDDFPRDDPRIVLPFGKVQSVTNIVYANAATTTATLTAASSPVGYQESLLSDTAPFLLPPYGNSWPSVTKVIDPVKVTLVAGYGDTATSPPGVFPADLLMALKVKLADYYERRSSDDVRNAAIQAAEALAQPYVLPVW
jgi:uncharacterized phiE125 gp8 family phage protein